MDELHDASQDGAQSTPVWAIFSDLMAALVGIFVLLLAVSYTHLTLPTILRV